MVREDYVYEASQTGTLCGAKIITTRSPMIQWIATIGGVVEVDEKLYALTASHRPADQAESGDTSSSTIYEQDYRHDVKSAILLDYLALKFAPAKPRSTELSGTGPFPELSTRYPLTEEGNHDQDWRLVPISTSHYLPNSFQRDGPTTTYITDHLDALARRDVIILACPSDSGFRGTLLPAPSFLSIDGGPIRELWTVTSNGPHLQAGDSGAWVVDDEHGRLIGMVAAGSGDDVYVVPFHVQMQEMEKAQTWHRAVSLPSPLRCLLDLATANRTIPHVRDGYIDGATSYPVLEASKAKDALALALFELLRNGILASKTSMGALRTLLCNYAD